MSLINRKVCGVKNFINLVPGDIIYFYDGDQRKYHATVLDVNMTIQEPDWTTKLYDNEYNSIEIYAITCIQREDINTNFIEEIRLYKQEANCSCRSFYNKVKHTPIVYSTYELSKIELDTILKKYI